MPIGLGEGFDRASERGQLQPHEGVNVPPRRAAQGAYLYLLHTILNICILHSTRMMDNVLILFFVQHAYCIIDNFFNIVYTLALSDQS